jgi:hypothetical protein
MPSAQPVTLPRLFADPARSPAVIARVARDRLTPVVGADCINGTVSRGGGEGLAPDAANYSTFATTPSALVVGLGLGQFSFASCGSQSVAVPWSLLRNGLSSDGKALVAKLR